MAAQRHVAVVAAVEPYLQLVLKRLRMKPLRLDEDAVDQLLRYAVPDEVEEADILQGEAQLRGDRLQRARCIGKIVTDIEHRDLAGTDGRGCEQALIHPTVLD